MTPANFQFKSTILAIIIVVFNNVVFPIELLSQNNNVYIPENLQVFIPDEDNRNEIRLIWEHNNSNNDEFLGFQIFQNDIAILGQTTTDTTYNLSLENEGTYVYEVQAKYLNGNSDLSNRAIITYHEDDYFNFLEGNGNGLNLNNWTIYITTAKLGEAYMAAGDEIAIYQDDLLVGKTHLNQEPSYNIEGSDVMVVFNEFSNGPGFTPGEPFSFSFYDASSEQEYNDVDEYTFLQETDNAYVGNVFPDEQDPVSYLDITFEVQLQIPSNLTASTEGHDVTLNWDNNVSRDIIGYEIYRNDLLLNENPINSSHYIDQDVISGQYEYYIKAVYDEGTSLPSEPVAITIDFVEFDPVDIDEPESPMEVIIHQADIMNESLEIFDEVGIFKFTETDTICIDAVSLTENFTKDTLYVSQDIIDTDEIDGFNPNDTLYYRLYDYSSDKLYQDILVSFPSGEEDTSFVFIPSETTHVNLNWLPYAPINLSYEVEDYDVHLNWEESPKNIGLNLLGYNIYRDYEKINTEIITTENYTDTALFIETYAYHVKALYVGSISRWSDSVHVTIGNQFFLPIQETESEENMTFEFFGAEVDGVPLTTYDQVAVFAMTEADTLICVGAGSVRDEITNTETLSIKAFRDNPDTDMKDGFAVGDSIYYKFWDESTGNVYSYLERSFPFDAGLGFNHDHYSYSETCKVSLEFFTPPPVKFLLDDDTTYCRNTSGNIEITTEDFKNIKGFSLSLSVDTSKYTFDTLLIQHDFLDNSDITFTGNTLSIDWASDNPHSLDGYDTLYTLINSIHENGNSFLNWNESTINGMPYQEATYQNTTFFIEKLPNNPGAIFGDDQVCNGTGFSQYSINEISNADSYSWELADADAGEINENNTEATIIWNTSFEGLTTLTASGENQCGTGTESEKDIEITNTVYTGVSISASTADCENDTITFTATGINGGNNPEYNWYINDAMHYSHNTTLISDDFTDEDQVYCELISSSECVQNNPAQSETISLELNPLPAKPLPITGPDEICHTIPVSYYTTPGAQYADDYVWTVTPSAHADEVISNGNNAEVYWNDNTHDAAYIEVRGINECGSGEARQFITLRPVCTDDDSQPSESIKVYPNPFKENITIELGVLKSGAQVMITDLRGTLVHSEEMTAPHHLIPTDHLPRDMYILKVINGDEVSYRKVVKK